MKTNCERCGKLCQTDTPINPDARLLKRSIAIGLCADCAITEFIKKNDVLNEILERKGVSQLLDPRSIEQFGKVIIAGNADTNPNEIDWNIVVKNWDLPFKKKRKVDKKIT